MADFYTESLEKVNCGWVRPVVSLCKASVNATGVIRGFVRPVRGTTHARFRFRAVLFWHSHREPGATQRVHAGDDYHSYMAGAHAPPQFFSGTPLGP
jgi:hypothetical protein